MLALLKSQNCHSRTLRCELISFSIRLSGVVLSLTTTADNPLQVYLSKSIMTQKKVYTSLNFPDSVIEECLEMNEGSAYPSSYRSLWDPIVTLILNGSGSVTVRTAQLSKPLSCVCYTPPIAHKVCAIKVQLSFVHL